jgi:hypothetical protein
VRSCGHLHPGGSTDEEIWISQTGGKIKNAREGLCLANGLCELEESWVLKPCSESPTWTGTAVAGNIQLKSSTKGIAPDMDAALPTDYRITGTGACQTNVNAVNAADASWWIKNSIDVTQPFACVPADCSAITLGSHYSLANVGHYMQNVVCDAPNTYGAVCLVECASSNRPKGEDMSGVYQCGQSSETWVSRGTPLVCETYFTCADLLAADCDTNALCTSFGDNRCKCKAGYSGDGYSTAGSSGCTLTTCGSLKDEMASRTKIKCETATCESRRDQRCLAGKPRLSAGGVVGTSCLTLASAGLATHECGSTKASCTNMGSGNICVFADLICSVDADCEENESCDFGSGSGNCISAYADKCTAECEYGYEAYGSPTYTCGRDSKYCDPLATSALLAGESGADASSNADELYKVFDDNALTYWKSNPGFPQW